MKNTISPSKGVRRTPEEIQRLIAEYQESGLTQGQYAAQLGVAPSTLIRWLRGVRPERRSPKRHKAKFVEVDVSASRAFGGHGVYQIELPSGIRLRAEGGWRMDQVSQLLSILQRS